MVKSLRRVFSVLLGVLVLLVMFDVSLNAASEVTDIGIAKYYVDEVKQENYLPFGVKQATHKAFTSAAAGEVTSMGLGITDPFIANKYYQQQVNVLEVPSDTNVRVTPWAYVSQGNWNLSTVRQIANDYEAKNPGNKVIAAINGDFFDINAEKLFPRTPSGAHASMGDFYKTLTGAAIGFTNDGSTETLVGNIGLTRSSHMTLAVYNANNEIIKEFQIDKINAEPTGNEVSVHYAKWALEAGWSSQRIVDINVENAFVVDNGEYALPSTNRTVKGTGAYTEDFYGRGVITSIGSATLSTGDFAIKSSNPEVVEALKVGTKIRAQYHFTGAHEGIGDIMGVGQTILFNGQKTGSDTNRHPRTMVGVKEDGTIIMTVVDGRQQDKLMYGASQAEMAAILKHYGAVEGYNLDGGGSSTMLILKDGDFEVTNSPSDGRERTDGNAILITVKVPNVEHSGTDIKDNGLTISTNVLDENPTFNNMYVKLNNEYKLVENNKAVFTNLDPNIEYVYDLYTKEGEDYIPLVITGRVKTAKRTPRIDSVNISYSDNELLFNFSYYDPDGAISRKNIQVGEEKKLVTGNQIVFANFTGGISDSLEFSIDYDINDGNGRVTLVPENIKLQYGALVHFNITTYNIINKIRNIYSSNN